MPLKSVIISKVASELMKWVSWVELPCEILTDQGTSFISNVMWSLCSILHIEQLWTTIYHPQMDGLVERFNRTLKGMIRAAIQGDPCNWD